MRSCLSKYFADSHVCSWFCNGSFFYSCQWRMPSCGCCSKPSHGNGIIAWITDVSSCALVCMCIQVKSVCARKWTKVRLILFMFCRYVRVCLHLFWVKLCVSAHFCLLMRLKGKACCLIKCTLWRDDPGSREELVKKRPCSSCQTRQQSHLWQHVWSI